jgi:hypothetical protein
LQPLTAQTIAATQLITASQSKVTTQLIAVSQTSQSSQPSQPTIDTYASQLQAQNHDSQQSLKKQKTADTVVFLTMEPYATERMQLPVLAKPNFKVKTTVKVNFNQPRILLFNAKYSKDNSSYSRSA